MSGENTEIASEVVRAARGGAPVAVATVVRAPDAGQPTVAAKLLVRAQGGPPVMGARKEHLMTNAMERGCEVCREDEARPRYHWHDVLADLPVSVIEVLATQPPSKTCSACGRTYALAYTVIGWMRRARRALEGLDGAHPGRDGGGAV